LFQTKPTKHPTRPGTCSRLPTGFKPARRDQWRRSHLSGKRPTAETKNVDQTRLALSSLGPSLFLRRQRRHPRLHGLYFEWGIALCYDGTMKRHLRISSNSTVVLSQSLTSNLLSRGSRFISRTMDAGLSPVSRNVLTQSIRSRGGGQQVFCTRSLIIYSRMVSVWLECAYE
jgi:hypothetical protein